MALLHSTLSKSLSKLDNWAPITNGINGKADNGNFRVWFYNDHIARITASQHETFEEFSYAVIAKPQNTDFSTTEDATHLHVKGKHFNLSIDKTQTRFIFTNKLNNVINEDDTFGISWNGEQVTTYKKLQQGERFIGLGEKTGPLDRRGQGYQNWNTDNFAYHSGADPLYCSTPFYIGIHNGLVYGIFLDNTFKSFINFGASNNRFSSFSADKGDMNYYFIYGESVAEIIQHYTHLTGRMPLPPLWSIGYQQCRYSYFPDTEVQSIADTFHEKDIPADVIVFDIHYMEA